MILLPKFGQYKPRPVSAINRGLAEEHGAFWLSIANTGLFLHDLISGRSINAPGAVVPSQDGLTAKYDGILQRANLTIPLPGATTGNDYIIAARVMATATQANSPGAAFGLYSGAGASQTGFGIGFDTANAVGAAYLHGNGAGLAARSSGVQNQWYTVYVAANNNGGASYFHRAWIDGIPATTAQNGEQIGGTSALDEIAVGAQHRSAGFLRNFVGQLAWASILYLPGGNLQFTDDSAQRLFRSGYPYNLFARRIWIPVSALAGASYTLSPSGGVVFAGNNIVVRNKTLSTSGSLTLSGTVRPAHVKTQLTTGGVSFAGNAPITLTNGATNYIITPSGGITFSGTAAEIKTKQLLPSGSINFSGTNIVVKHNVYGISGGITLSGTATISFIPSGVAAVSTRLPLTGVGQ